MLWMAATGIGASKTVIRPVLTSSGRRPDEVSAGITAFRPELDDMVGGSNDVGVVLDDDDGVASVEEGAEGGEEFLDVVEVEVKRIGLSAWRERLAVPEPDEDGP